MGYRDYGPGYRGRDDRDIERGRHGDRGEQDRYGNYGRERYDAPFDRESRGAWSAGGYEEGWRNRDVESGRWSREREFNDAGDQGNWGAGRNRWQEVGNRDRFEGRSGLEGRSMERRGEFTGRGGFDRDYYDRDIAERGYRGIGGYEGSGEYETSRGYGGSREWGVGGPADMAPRYGRAMGLTSGFQGTPRYASGIAGYGESVGYTGVSTRAGQVNYTGRGPRGYRRSDDAIRDEVNERLTRHPEIDATDVEVRVEGSEVVLTGIVEDRRAKRLAEDIAEEVWGVDDVRNELKVRHGFLAKLTGEQADEREIARATSREATGQTTTSESPRRAGRTNATAGAGTGGTSGT